MLHRTELSPVGPDAPTIRMNLDTLYSVGVYHNDGEMSVTIPESGLYQSIMILDTDGYTPFFFAEPGTFPVKNESEYLMIAVRTVVKDRHNKASFEEAYAAQKGIKVEGNGSETYVMPPQPAAFDQVRCSSLTCVLPSPYVKEMPDSSISLLYSAVRAWSCSWLKAGIT